MGLFHFTPFQESVLPCPVPAPHQRNKRPSRQQQCPSAKTSEPKNRTEPSQLFSSAVPVLQIPSHGQRHNLREASCPRGDGSSSSLAVPLQVSVAVNHGSLSGNDSGNDGLWISWAFRRSRNNCSGICGWSRGCCRCLGSWWSWLRQGQRSPTAITALSNDNGHTQNPSQIPNEIQSFKSTTGFFTGLSPVPFFCLWICTCKNNQATTQARHAKKMAPRVGGEYGNRQGYLPSITVGAPPGSKHAGTTESLYENINEYFQPMVDQLQFKTDPLGAPTGDQTFSMWSGYESLNSQYVLAVQRANNVFFNFVLGRRLVAFISGKKMDITLFEGPGQLLPLAEEAPVKFLQMRKISVSSSYALKALGFEMELEHSGTPKGKQQIAAFVETIQRLAGHTLVFSVLNAIYTSQVETATPAHCSLAPVAPGTEARAQLESSLVNECTNFADLNKRVRGLPRQLERGRRIVESNQGGDLDTILCPIGLIQSLPKLSTLDIEYDIHDAKYASDPNNPTTNRAFEKGIQEIQTWENMAVIPLPSQHIKDDGGGTSNVTSREVTTPEHNTMFDLTKGDGLAEYRSNQRSIKLTNMATKRLHHDLLGVESTLIHCGRYVLCMPQGGEDQGCTDIDTQARWGEMDGDDMCCDDVEQDPLTKAKLDEDPFHWYDERHRGGGHEVHHRLWDCAGLIQAHRDPLGMREDPFVAECQDLTEDRLNHIMGGQREGGIYSLRGAVATNEQNTISGVLLPFWGMMKKNCLTINDITAIAQSARSTFLREQGVTYKDFDAELRNLAMQDDARTRVCEFARHVFPSMAFSAIGSVTDDARMRRLLEVIISRNGVSFIGHDGIDLSDYFPILVQRVKELKNIQNDMDRMFAFAFCCSRPCLYNSMTAVKKNIRIPDNFLLIRPLPTYRASSIVLMVAGSETGFTDHTPLHPLFWQDFVHRKVFGAYPPPHPSPFLAPLLLLLLCVRVSLYESSLIYSNDNPLTSFSTITIPRLVPHVPLVAHHQPQEHRHLVGRIQ